MKLTQQTPASSAYKSHSFGARLKECHYGGASIQYSSFVFLCVVLLALDWSSPSGAACYSGIKVCSCAICHFQHALFWRCQPCWLDQLWNSWSASWCWGASPGHSAKRTFVFLLCSLSWRSCAAAFSHKSLGARCDIVQRRCWKHIQSLSHV